MHEIYISTDVEPDGLIPGPPSMLSIGSAAYTAEKVLLSTFSANLETLPGAQAHPKTAEWWATQPVAWAACRRDLVLDQVRGRETIQSLGARHQVLRCDLAEGRLPAEHEAKHAEAVVR